MGVPTKHTLYQKLVVAIFRERKIFVREGIDCAGMDNARRTQGRRNFFCR